MAKKLMKGCAAMAEAAVRAGCRFYAGYPITPQSELPEYLSKRLPEVGGIFIQGESEVASINMVFGAAATGTRAMTSSSGLGMSLKAEGISYIVGARVPAVMINVARGEPGLGSIQPSQQDYLAAAKAMGHGGFHQIVMAPYTVQEAVDMVYEAFDLAERDRCPVLVLTDGCLAQVMEEVELPPMKELSSETPDWSIGTFEGSSRPMRFVSSMYDEDVVEKLNIQACEMYRRWEREDQRVEEYMTDDAEYIIVAYGTSARVGKYAINELRNEGVKTGLIRPRFLYPFPKASFENIDYSKVRAIIDMEMAIPAQMYDDIALEVKDKVSILSYGRSGGVTLKNEETVRALREMIGGIEK